MRLILGGATAVDPQLIHPPFDFLHAITDPLRSSPSLSSILLARQNCISWEEMNTIRMYCCSFTHAQTLALGDNTSSVSGCIQRRHSSGSVGPRCPSAQDPRGSLLEPSWPAWLSSTSQTKRRPWERPGRHVQAEPLRTPESFPRTPYGMGSRPPPSPCPGIHPVIQQQTRTCTLNVAMNAKAPRLSTAFGSASRRSSRRTQSTPPAAHLAEIMGKIVRSTRHGDEITTSADDVARLTQRFARWPR